MNKEVIKNSLLKPIGGQNNNNSNGHTQNKHNNSPQLTLNILVNYLKDEIIAKSVNIKNIKNNNNNNYIIMENTINKIFEEIGNMENLEKIISDFDFNFEFMGVLEKIPSKLKFYNNVSFLSSVLHLIKDDFEFIEEKSNGNVDENNFIKNFRNYLITLYGSSKFNELGYKARKFNHNEISNQIYNLNFTDKVIKLFAHFFNINIFVFNTKADRLDYYGSDDYIPFKKNIFLISSWDLETSQFKFKPVIIDKKKYLDHQHDFIQYLLEDDGETKVNKVESLSKTFERVEEDLTSYIEDKKIKFDRKDRVLMRYFDNINKPKEEIMDEEDKSQGKKNMKDIDCNGDDDEDDNESVKSLNKLVKDILETEDNNYDESNHEFDSDSENIIAGVTEIDNLNKKEKPVKQIKFTEKSLEKMKVTELQELAKKNNIEITEKVNGKKKNKVKQQLIDDLVNL